jgi:hypothetical protein
MKKIAVAVAVASALGASSVGVQAYTMGTFDFGVLVPVAYSTATEGTYIGLISRCGGNIYWSAYDQDSKHLEDDVIPATPLDMVSVDVGAAIGMTGPAYMLFQMDRNSAANANPPNTPDGVYDTYDDGCLAGNAFWVDLPMNDVTYVPTFPVDLTDVNDGVPGHSVGLIGGVDYISSLVAGAQWREWIFMRYFVDNVAANADLTKIYAWTVCKPPATQQTRFYNADQDWLSAPVDTPKDELNIIDPETYIIPRDTGFKDGFIPWEVAIAANPNASGAGGGDNLRYCNHNGYNSDVNDKQAAVSWSQMYSSVFGAEQTVLNPHACYKAGDRPWDAGVVLTNSCPPTAP